MNLFQTVSGPVLGPETSGLFEREAPARKKNEVCFDVHLPQMKLLVFLRNMTDIFLYLSFRATMMQTIINFSTKTTHVALYYEKYYSYL